MIKMNPLENKDVELIPTEGTVTELPQSVEQETPVTAAETENITPEQLAAPSLSEDNSQNAAPASTTQPPLSREELVEKLKTLVEKEAGEIKDEVENIKQLFYKSLKAENENLKAKSVEEGETGEFIPPKDELENTLKALLNQYRIKRTAHVAQLEQERENNLIQKKHILEQMKNLTENNDDVSANIKEFKDLQQKWNSIGQVSQKDVSDLWKQYNTIQEKFWDLVKINNELREYDFKKNLEAKILLCEAAERLADESDVVPAFRQLQQLHDEWRETGPVARDLREEIWSRFKNASTVVNKKHQDFFENLRKLEDENMNAKAALCEKIEAVDYKELTSFKAWDEALEKVTAYQAEWRTIGFAPRKNNQKIYERYRKACDAFFTAKTAFLKETKNELSVNMDKKRALCDKAEALKNSVDWKETTDKFIQMQKEWKTIGAVPRKYSDELWKRFIAACDYFFEQRNKNKSDSRNEEAGNLAKKKALIEQINAIQETEDSKNSLAALRELIAEWNATGFVPFKEKDKLYKEYRAAVDKQFDALNVDVANRRLDTFRSNLEDIASKGENKLYHEREKMTRAYEHLKAEITTYENNIGFFTSSSKKGGGLIKEMEKKIQTLKEECSLLEEKIKLLEKKLAE
jgi:chromosome segregation ATPase